MSQHDPLAGDEPARESRRQYLFRQVVPAEQAGAVRPHQPSPTANVRRESSCPSSNRPVGSLNVITRAQPPISKNRSRRGVTRTPTSAPGSKPLLIVRTTWDWHGIRQGTTELPEEPASVQMSVPPSS